MSFVFYVLAALTVAMAIWAVFAEWRIPEVRASAREAAISA